MKGITAAVAAALLGAVASLGSAQAAPIGTGLVPAPSAVSQAAYQYHYFCAPWNDAWGYPGCQGYEREVAAQAEGQPVVTCHVRRTRWGHRRRVCTRRW